MFIPYLCCRYAYLNLDWSKSLINTSASYSNIWLPFMWWHFSMMTGPFRRDTSRQRSSVRISLSAVYENTYRAHHRSMLLHLLQFSGVEWSRMVKIVLKECTCTGLVCSHLVPTHPVAVKKADFLILFPSHVVHTLVSLHISDLWVKQGQECLLYW